MSRAPLESFDEIHWDVVIVTAEAAAKRIAGVKGVNQVVRLSQDWLALALVGIYR